jgi:hypothetical protein
MVIDINSAGTQCKQEMDPFRGPKPRINASMLQMNLGNMCVLVGRIQKASPAKDQLTIMTSDEQIVNVECGYRMFEVTQGYVELIVSIDSDGRLRAHAATSYGDNFGE